MSRVLPILFNTDMVRAILDGRKTVTRRIVKPANPFRNKEGYCQGDGLWIDGYNKNDKPNGHIKDYNVSSCWMPKKYYIEKYAPYHIGDILYVRETWCWKPCWDCGMDTEGHNCCNKSAHKIYNHDMKEYGCYGYRADQDNNVYPSDGAWRPSIHLPKEAARIWLKVTDVRVERLQDIDGRGVLKEGLNSHVHPQADYFDGNQREMFEKLWNSTLKKPDLGLYGWDANPWVWVIEFERCEKPKGEL